MNADTLATVHPEMHNRQNSELPRWMQQLQKIIDEVDAEYEKNQQPRGA